ncbi:lipase family alpha/beta hydrolase [Fodinicola acaciae]|uniref:lipase family alpha/beta hydrolase n=1 Tax=Fodinicola acaciae TaxID=2681555 RepID=UPI0013D29F5D|nr:lipase [Fodinicola acaciae]
MKTKIYYAPQDVLGPVLIVPGYGGDVSVLSRLAKRITDSGRTVRVLDLPDKAQGDLRTQAKLIAAAADRLRAAAPSLDVIGYSAGGVAVRLWQKDFGGAPHTRRVVTIASPHHGTELAGLAFAVASDTCPTACQQLAQHSSLLTALNSGDETPPGPLWASMWTAYDDTVVPPSSGELKSSVNTQLQKVCADDRTRHTQLPNDPLVIGLVLASIGLDKPIEAGPQDCERLRESAAVES